jgi:hypothetical protein
MPPARQPQTARGRMLWDLSRAERVAMDTLTVMHAARDPFRLDTPASHRDGQWFARQIENLLTPAATVHLRGLHYRIVAAADVRKPNGEIYVNTDADWVWLGDCASKAARWLGYVPFKRIIDERNAPPEVFPGPIIEAVRTGVGVSEVWEVPMLREVLPSVWCSGLAAEQPYRIIMIGEKSSLAPVLRPLAGEVRGELLLPNGEMSDTLIYDLAERAVRDGRRAIVLYFSDFDPSGYTMPVNVARKLQALAVEEFPELEIKLHAVALTLDQVRANDLPSTPLKESERRADKWRETMGHEQTEIDALAALRPEILQRIARAAVTPFFDFGLNERAVTAQAAWRRQADRLLHGHPAYPLVCARIGWALDGIKSAHAQLLAAQAKAVELQIALPPVEAVEPEIDEPPPEPLFTTEDDFIDATRKLVAYKKLDGETS